MTEKVSVLVTGIHENREPGQAPEKDVIETKSQGICRQIGDLWYIRYEEWQEGMTEPVSNLLKVRPGHMELTRKGAAGARLLFETGRKTAGSYVTPFGALPVTVQTTRVLLEEEENSLRIRADYTLDAGGGEAAKASLRIQVTAEEA